MYLVQKVFTCSPRSNFGLCHLSRLGKSLDLQEPKDCKPQPRDKGAADPGSGARGCEEVRDCTGLRERKEGAQKTEVPARQSNTEKGTSHPQAGERIRASPEYVDDWWGQSADSELPNPCEMEELRADPDDSVPIALLDGGGAEICLRPTYSSFCKDVSLLNV
ncbi:hypothetical protein B0H13DRAFT_1853529 [Mycena leptocephala]|nr:hypothetical protein B0H13DRAFT_1853529 [Mycena leptocephala]